MKAMLLEQIAPIDNSPLENGRSAHARAETGRDTDQGPLLRDLPDRSARDRRRPAAAKNAHYPGAPDRGNGGKTRAGMRQVQGRAARGRGVASGIPAEQCEFCKAGKENLCESARFTGYHADGGYAEYALAPEAYCYGIPPGLFRRRSRAAFVRGHYRLPVA